MLRDSIKAAQVAAMKAGDKPRLAAVRLILAKLKDRDIELRTATTAPDDDTTVVEVLQKMVKQRRESITLYEQGGRQELADAEAAELAVIEEFLPQSAERGRNQGRDRRDHCGNSVRTSVKDMGKVVAALKAAHGTQLDMSKASGLVKAALG
jgi:uncharacterized protein YqeY